MSDGPGGFDDEVSDEQIAAYSALPIHERIAWIEETARVAYLLSTPEVRALGGLAAGRGDADSGAGCGGALSVEVLGG